MTLTCLICLSSFHFPYVSLTVPFRFPYVSLTFPDCRYDVAFTAYHARDGQALVEMSRAAGTAGSGQVAALRTRLAATETALHRDLYDGGTGLYANRLYNGSFYRRWVRGLRARAHRLDGAFEPDLRGNA